MNWLRVNTSEIL